MKAALLSSITKPTSSEEKNGPLEGDEGDLIARRAFMKGLEEKMAAAQAAVAWLRRSGWKPALRPRKNRTWISLR